MDRDRVSAITHGDRPFHNPLDPDRVQEAFDRLRLGRNDRVLDVGCGAGELLISLAERHGCGGLGIDASTIAIEEAQRRLASRAPDADVEFAALRADELDRPDAEYAAACCLGSMHVLGGLQPGLTWLAKAAKPGGAVVVADGFWARPPDPAYLEVLGATSDELPSFEGLLNTCADAGLRHVWAATSSPQDWERYEWTLIDNGDRYVRENPDEPLASDVRAWIGAARRRLGAPGGTVTLGFALLVLRT
jgi:SAM-dependent methyltransferase